MLILEVRNQALEEQLSELLQQAFNGDSERMLAELVEKYTAQSQRLQFSGILKWPQDGVEFQRELRNEWQ